MEDKKKHWESIYETKQPHEVSWTQEYPTTSISFIQQCNLPKSAKIIDIGGGDSKFVDALLSLGYVNISILDISKKALEKARTRLGPDSNKITWIESDILDFRPTEQYDVWHDRAAFHFLTSKSDVTTYLDKINAAVKRFFIVGTFSLNGPEKCSGLEICRYSEDQLGALLQPHFDKIQCITEDHITPFNSKQNFLFCCFGRNQNASKKMGYT